METLLPESQECKTFNPPPANLKGAVGGIHDGYFIICGGMVEIGHHRKTCTRMAMDSRTWEEEAIELPDGRSFASAVMVPRWGMWILGGMPKKTMVK